MSGLRRPECLFRSLNTLFATSAENGDEERHCSRRSSRIIMSSSSSLSNSSLNSNLFFFQPNTRESSRGGYFLLALGLFDLGVVGGDGALWSFIEEVGRLMVSLTDLVAVDGGLQSGTRHALDQQLSDSLDSSLRKYQNSGTTTKT